MKTRILTVIIYKGTHFLYNLYKYNVLYIYNSQNLCPEPDFSALFWMWHNDMESIIFLYISYWSSSNTPFSYNMSSHDNIRICTIEDHQKMVTM